MEARANRVEGTDLARVVAFTDGVFAIAITLLVLNLDVPELSSGKELADELGKLWPHLLAYFLSFAVVGRFWIIHHRVFAVVRSFDGRLLMLNLLYLAFIVLVPFTTELIGDYGDTTAAVVPYAAALGIAALVNWFMIRHLVRAEHVKPERREETSRYADTPSLMVPGAFLASIPVAFLSPYAAEAMWVLMTFFHPLRGRRQGSREPSATSSS